MNQSLADLPDACDVLVVGAGPAGSAAATWLARAGVDVRLVDQHTFPRDKTCGDALIADSHAAFKHLGVYEQVMAQAHPVSHVGFMGPRGRCLEIASTLAVLPRLQLDDLLCRAAVSAGARMHAPARFELPLTDTAGQVIGARLRQGHDLREIHARTVILATGAMPQALMAAGLCSRRAPSGVAFRAYVHHPEMARRVRRIEVIWHPRLRHGYGWVFPGPQDSFNIGVGVFHAHGEGTSGPVDLHERFEALREVHAGARELLTDGVMQGEAKGAPLRCTLSGAIPAHPGLLVAGEAVGSTYLLTGEGIGKAMETGMLAAQAVLAERAGQLGRVPLHEDYRHRLDALRPRFKLYEQASWVNAHPWLSDLVIWRANQSARWREAMGGVLNETSPPVALLSWQGLRCLLGG